MTIDDAIRILDNLSQEDDIVGFGDIKPAIKLGIEALEWIQLNRSVFPSELLERLPGETE